MGEGGEMMDEYPVFLGQHQIEINWRDTKKVYNLGSWFQYTPAPDYNKPPRYLSRHDDVIAIEYGGLPPIVSLIIEHSLSIEKAFSPLEGIASRLWYSNVPQERCTFIVYQHNNLKRAIAIDGVEIFVVELQETWNDNIATYTYKFVGFVNDGEAILEKVIEEYSE